MTILVTGCAGFIGFHVAKFLLEQNETIIGIDNLNDYYDVQLKLDRLTQLTHPNFSFYCEDIASKDLISKILKKNSDIQYIVHLAAQAGVRYSTQNPHAYAQSNLIGHLNMLELARQLPQLKHFVFASSSSVYGANTELPFSLEQKTDTPISFYAATKKSCEVMSYSYSHLYGINISGLRYFTVYGPWGRPDMAPMIFAQALFTGKPLQVFNHGDMRRNFTYIDDVVAGTINCMQKPNSGFHIYNIGNNRSEHLMDFIHHLEDISGKKAILEMKEMQLGDMKDTIADISQSTKAFGFEPKTNLKEGLTLFLQWFQNWI